VAFRLALARALSDAIPADIAKRRFTLRGAARERFSSDPVIGGRQMLLQDALAFLKRLRLVDLRETEEKARCHGHPRKDPRFTMDPELESLLPRCPVGGSRVGNPPVSRRLPRCPRRLERAWSADRRHSRFKLCASGPAYKIDELDLPDLQAVKNWMWEHHYSRRNYSLEAKAMPGADSSWLSKASTAATVAAGISSLIDWT